MYHTSTTFSYNLLFNEWNFVYEISSILNANISDPLSFIHIQYEHDNAHDSSGYLYLILRYIIYTIFTLKQYKIALESATIRQLLTHSRCLKPKLQECISWGCTRRGGIMVIISAWVIAYYVFICLNIYSRNSFADEKRTQ